MQEKNTYRYGLSRVARRGRLHKVFLLYYTKQPSGVIYVDNMFVFYKKKP